METWEMKMKKALGRGNRTCKGIEKKKSYNKKEISNSSEWPY